MKKLILPIGICILMIVFVLSFVSNLQSYKLTGEYNLGLSGGINNFMSGLIMNLIEVIAMCIAIFVYSKKFKDKRPKELTPVND